MALNINGTTGISGVDGSASAPALQGTDSNTGINFASDTVNINTGGSTRATVDSSGNLGIGNTDPSQARAVIQSASGTQLALVKDNNGASISLGGVTQPRILMEANPTASQLSIYTAGGSTYASPSWSERMRIDSNGIMNLKGYGSDFGDQTNHHCIQNVNASSWALQIVNSASFGYGVEIRVNADTNSREALYIYSSSGSEAKADIRSSGTFNSRTGTYGTYSDIKLKENIVDASSQWNDIKAVKVRNFNFKNDTSKVKMLGVVAQELESVCPSLVETNPDIETDENGDRVETGTTTKTVKSSILYMKAIKALQEARARIETLETKVAALEAG